MDVGGFSSCERGLVSDVGGVTSSIQGGVSLSNGGAILDGVLVKIGAEFREETMANSTMLGLNKDNLYNFGTCPALGTGQSSLSCSQFMNQLQHCMDSVQDLPFLSATTLGSVCFNCPNCSVEFRSADAVVSHLSVEGSCGCWLAHYLPNLHDTENVHYNEDPDAAHDSKLFFYFFILVSSLSHSSWA